MSHTHIYIDIHHIYTIYLKHVPWDPLALPRQLGHEGVPRVVRADAATPAAHHADAVLVTMGFEDVLPSGKLT